MESYFPDRENFSIGSQVSELVRWRAVPQKILDESVILLQNTVRHGVSHTHCKSCVLNRVVCLLKAPPLRDGKLVVTNGSLELGVLSLLLMFLSLTFRSFSHSSDLYIFVFRRTATPNIEEHTNDCSFFKHTIGNNTCIWDLGN